MTLLTNRRFASKPTRRQADFADDDVLKSDASRTPQGPRSIASNEARKVKRYALLCEIRRSHVRIWLF